MINNRDALWNAFNVPGYLFETSYMGPVIAADRATTAIAIDTITSEPALRAKLGTVKSALDICTGGVVRNAGLIEPLLSSDGVVTFGDIGDPQLRATQQTVAAARAGRLGLWQPHQTVMAERHPLWRNAIGDACMNAEVEKLDLYDLPKAAFGAVIAGHGPESTTENPEECEAGFRSLVDAGVPGAPILLTYSAWSDGYRVSGRRWPATKIGPVRLEDMLADTVNILRHVVVPADDMRPYDNQTSHGGIGLLIGIKQ